MNPLKPHLIEALGINAYVLDGSPRVTQAEICKYSRGNRSTNPFKKFLERSGSEALPPSGSEGFPQAERSGSTTAPVLRPNGSSVDAELISPELAALFIASELVNPNVSENVKRRAAQFMVITSAAGLSGLAKEVCGLEVTMVADADRVAKVLELGPKHYSNIGAKVKKLLYWASGLDLDDEFQIPLRDRHKFTGMPKDDVKYLGHTPKKVLQALISLIGEGALPALRETQRVSPNKNYRYGPSLEECMTDKAKARYAEVYSYFEMAVKARHHRVPFTPLDWQEIIALLQDHFEGRP